MTPLRFLFYVFCLIRYKSRAFIDYPIIFNFKHLLVQYIFHHPNLLPQLIMDTWTRQVGYPIITVSIEDGHVSATQKRFLGAPNLNASQIVLLKKENECEKKEKEKLLARLMKNKKGKKSEEDEKKSSDPNSPVNATIGYKWHVPLTYVTSENPHDSNLVWMNLTDGAFVPTLCSEHWQIQSIVLIYYRFNMYIQSIVLIYLLY